MKKSKQPHRATTHFIKTCQDILQIISNTSVQEISAEEIVDLVSFFSQHQLKINIKQEKNFDICGTGGTNKERINLSTALTTLRHK